MGESNPIKIFREKNSADSSVPAAILTKHPHFTWALYSLLGLFLLFFIINIFATYVLRLKVETAVVSARIETMVAPVNGYISAVYVAVGEQVKKGKPLLKIENLDLERELQLARIQVAESQLNIDYYQQLLANEHQRLNVYQKIGHNRVISAKSKVHMSQQAMITTQHDLNRFTELLQKHYVSKAIWEKKNSDYIRAREQLKNAKAEQRVENHSLKAVEEGLYFTGTKTEGIEHDLYAELDAAQKRTQLNSKRADIYKHLINKLTLRAPFDGKITQILKSTGNTADSVKPIIFIEENSTNKNIIAYLTQNEVIHIGSSAQVKIYIPATGKTYRGKVIEINRTEGFIDEVKAQYRWRDFQIDRSAMVTIALQTKDQKRFNQHAFSGMPAMVYFSKKWILF